MFLSFCFEQWEKLLCPGSFQKLLTLHPLRLLLVTGPRGPVSVLSLKPKTNRTPLQDSVFKVPILKDKSHVCWEAQGAALSCFQDSLLFSVMSGIFSSLVSLPFHLIHHSVTESHLHCQGRITPGQVRLLVILCAEEACRERTSFFPHLFILFDSSHASLVCWHSLRWPQTIRQRNFFGFSLSPFKICFCP